MRTVTLIAVLAAALPAAAVQAESGKPKEAKECRATAVASGRLPGRVVCKTAKQWEAEDFFRDRGAIAVRGQSVSPGTAGTVLAR